MSVTLTYTQKLDQIYKDDPAYLGYKVLLDEMSFAEGTKTQSNVEYLHKIYLNQIKSDPFSYSEDDLSFGSLLDFIKDVSKKGLERHEKATGAAKESLANLLGAGGKKLGDLGDELFIATSGLDTALGKGQDALENLVSKARGKVEDWDRARFQKEMALEDEFGPENVDEILRSRAATEGWKRDAAAKVAMRQLLGGMSKDEVLKAMQKHPLHASMAKTAELEAKGRESAGDKVKGAMGLLDTVDEADLDVGDKGNFTTQEREAQEGFGEGDLHKKGLTIQTYLKSGNPKLKGVAEKMLGSLTPEQLEEPEIARAHKMLKGSDEEAVDKALKSSIPASLKRMFGEDYMENLDMASTYGEGKMKYAGKYKEQYQDYKEKAKKAKDKEEKEKYMKMAEKAKTKMAYSEAIESGNTERADKILEAGVKTLKKNVGFSYSETDITVGELLDAAVDFVFAEKFGEGSPHKMEAHDHGRYNYNTAKNYPGHDQSAVQNSGYGDFQEGEGEEAGAEAGIDMAQLEQMIQVLSEEELAMLKEAVEAAMGGGEAKEEKEEMGEYAGKKDMKYAGDKEYAEKEDMKYAGDKEYAEKEKKEDKKEKDSSYSEQLKVQDQALEQFYSDCRAAFTEFEYINQHYNVPLQFGEGIQYDFSEWVDAFRDANSASFNMYGNKCGFNGKLPESIVVVEADHPEAAYSVYDTAGNFVTLSGIKAFKDLAFSETFKQAYCTSSQGSRLKSDRVARAALCLK